MPYIFINLKIANGPIFCHVESNSAIGQLRPTITDGNQKCVGPTPSFNSIEIIKTTYISWCVILICMGVENIKNVTVTISLDPVAWAKKYLILLSVSWFFCEIEINGINDRRFISNIAHINNQ